MKNWKVKSKKFGKKNNEPAPYDSEAVRLASLKKQKQAFKEKEQVIRNALNSTEGNTKNKKVVFDDETIEAYEKNTKVVEKQKKPLFDEDDDDDNDDTQLNFCEKPKVVTLGNDERFTLSQHFLEDDEEVKPGANHEQVDDEFTEEKKKQLEILQSVVGKPIQQRIAKPAVEKNLYRYDPTSKNHEEYEVEKEIEEKPARKKKRKIEKEKTVEEETSVPVSSDVFFSVSNNLTDALKSNEEFSLLKSFGAVVEPENTEDKNKNSMTSIQSSMSYDSLSKNPFKYDSTDDENDNFNDADFGAKKTKTQVDVNKNFKETFFFSINDPRFKDAEVFFKSQAVMTESFNNVRRELKQIVRKKIRNNAKKNLPMKRKIQTMKKRSRKN